MSDWNVNPDALARLIGLHPGKGQPSPMLEALMRPKNPKYHVTKVVNLVLSSTGAEMLSHQVGRVYFHEGTTLYAVTLSDYAMGKLVEQIEQALEARPGAK